MQTRKHKPTTFYHMQIVNHTQQGWRVTKHDTFQKEKGTFLRKDEKTLFIGWSGRVILDV
jgi:hypothetical protein